MTRLGPLWTAAIFLMGGLFIRCSHSPKAPSLADEALSSRQTGQRSLAYINAKSKFDGLRQLFQSGKMPPKDEFAKEAFYSGKCAFEQNPQTFIIDSAHTYVEKDFALGAITYFVPGLFSLTPGTIPKSIGADFKLAQERHSEERRQRESFSALQFEFPSGAPLQSLSRESQSGSAYLSYNKRGLASASKPGPLAKLRLRLAYTGEKRAVLVMEHLCPYITGCLLPGNPRRYGFQEPYGYCYYSKLVEFASTPGSGTMQYVPIPNPVTEPEIEAGM